MDKPAGLHVTDLRLRLNGLEVLRDVNLEVEPGQFVAIVGPSGCGKSSLLNVLAGLLTESPGVEVEGEVRWGGKAIRNGKDWQGRIGYVFQKDALLPWYTVLQNVEVGLKIRQVPAPDRTERAKELISLVGLRGFEHHFPHQLSGGMRQRAALVRTLAYNPDIIFLDEPFAAVDAHTRMRLQRELTKIWSREQVTMLFVTHDLTEAVVMAQRVAVFSQRPGRVLRVYDVPFPYPRDPVELQSRREFALLHAEIWSALAEQFSMADDMAAEESRPA